MATLNMIKRCQVSDVTEMKSGEEKVLHIMVASPNGNDQMVCQFSNEVFNVTFHPTCATTHQNQPSPVGGTMVTLMGLATADGTLEVVKWNECCQAELDARRLERVVALLRARKLRAKEQAEIEALWDDDATGLDQINVEQFSIELNDTTMLKDEMVSDESYGCENSLQMSPPSTAAEAEDLVSPAELCDLMEDKASHPLVTKEQSVSTEMVQESDVPIHTDLWSIWKYMPSVFSPSGDCNRN